MKKSIIALLSFSVLSSCSTGEQGQVQYEKHEVDSVVYVNQHSGMPPTFRRVYWKYYVGDYWNISHVPLNVGDTVLVPTPR